MASLEEEIDGAVRQEELLRFLKKHGRLLIGGVVLAVLASGGYAVWQQQQTAAMARSALLYHEAEASAKDSDDWQALAAQAAGGYRWLARVQAAALARQAGQIEQAAALLNEVADDTTAPLIWRDYARLTSARLQLQKNPATAQAIADGVLANNNALAPLAREVLALAYAEQKNFAPARALLEQNINDTTLMPAMRERSRLLARAFAGAKGV